MASVNLTGKRRRVDNAASTLSKPFKSPLRRPVQSQASNEAPSATIKKEEEKDSKGKESEAASLRSASSKPDPDPTPTSTPTTSPHPASQTRKRKNPTNTMTPTKPKPLFQADHLVTNLQKQQRALQSRLASLRSDLDTTQQALRIETSNRDTELEALITKWRVVAQDAAEEVFAGAQERVSRMGGMKAWNESMRSQNDTHQMWEKEETENWFGSTEAEGEDVDEEVVRRKEEMLEEMGVEKEKEDEKKQEEEAKSEEEVGSTLMVSWAMKD